LTDKLNRTRRSLLSKPFRPHSVRFSPFGSADKWVLSVERSRIPSALGPLLPPVRACLRTHCAATLDAALPHAELVHANHSGQARVRACVVLVDGAWLLSGTNKIGYPIFTAKTTHQGKITAHGPSHLAQALLCSKTKAKGQAPEPPTLLRFVRTLSVSPDPRDVIQAPKPYDVIKALDPFA
jgi:hypothetical protein